jgi:hypothetical protein
LGVAGEQQILAGEAEQNDEALVVEGLSAACARAANTSGRMPSIIALTLSAAKILKA